MKYIHRMTPHFSSECVVLSCLCVSDLPGVAMGACNLLIASR